MVLDSLTRASSLPWRSIQELAIPPVLVVAPHPDDETLGCGGAIALLRALNCPVEVLVVSDGTMSHPNSIQYPAPVLQALRASETLTAMQILGVEKAEVTFLNLPDGAVPLPQTDTWEDGLLKCREAIASIKPQTVFLPWRSDPHPDHRATWHLVQAAMSYLHLSPQIIEYPIWDWDKQQQGMISNSTLMKAWRINIQSVRSKKQQAIAAYRSQISNLIEDDPWGFQLSPQMLDNFLHPWEVYLEQI
ncbi:PIG-L deacetylase family protein [Merismopedia glauca]|uniref:PIG-L domain-containing protein n=1 Tax=Merismopedia glauca CCAP 1448/3 TaxID=1296344 RepID=A0A2T1C557_9CYAN|nr:PIG-L family deacetylase [Merismopedia glauca]PSB03277.1 PIG-L domain-containing protein [Merismopedia glauca CCAP 1448/3]